MGQNSITPTNREVFFQGNEFIVSKTCTKGRITYVNRSFMRLSGFKEEQLLGQPHSIIRHPSMPRSVFKLLWQTLQQGDEFFGYVKNMTADGSYYWVFANVTPDLDEGGQLRGYYSVRRQPNREGVAFMEPLYQKMLQVEAAASASAAPTAGLEVLESFLADKHLSYTQFVLDLYDGTATKEIA